MNILHAFADTGVESEALAAYGDVTRVGIDPVDNPHTDTLIQADIREWQPEEQYDLGLFHPPCQQWAAGSHIHGNPEDRHDNLIPLARETARSCCDEWIIENVPNAPLHNPVVLNGGMFGLPLHFERAFETSYHVDQPRNQQKLGTVPEHFQEHHRDGSWKGTVAQWQSAKGYSGEYDSRALKRTAIPRAYLNYLIRPLLGDRE